MSAEVPIVVTVNGAPCPVPTGASLHDLVQQFGHAQHGVATAVNGAFVARNARPERVLQAGDHITFFQPIVGG